MFGRRSLDERPTARLTGSYLTSRPVSAVFRWHPGIAVGEHTERSFILDLALALAEDRRRDIVRKTKNGLETARKQGKVGGRRPVVDDDRRAAILDRRRRGESIRTIAAGVKVSVGVVHKTLAEAKISSDPAADEE